VLALKTLLFRGSQGSPNTCYELLWDPTTAELDQSNSIDFILFVMPQAGPIFFQTEVLDKKLSDNSYESSEDAFTLQNSTPNSVSITVPEF